MTGPIDKLFGVHAQAMQARAQRSQLLATNIANADTPNYKARDVDFKAVLRRAAEVPHATDMTMTDAKHLDSQGANAQAGVLAPMSIGFRAATQPALDGNTVDIQREQSAFAQNNVRYLASLQFLSNRISGLVRVLREE